MINSRQNTSLGDQSRQSAAMRLLDPVVLTRIGNLDLIARRVVDGFISGLHRTNQLGASTDFAEHRPYTPGDDVRNMDWRVYARTDRLYVKTFEAQTNANIVLALDCSKSMDYASGEVTKFDYSKMAVASLAHLTARQRDRAGLGLFSQTLTDYLPASSRNRDPIVRYLHAVKASGGSGFAPALASLAQRLVRRGIVVVISDFYDEVSAIVRALNEIQLRHHDVIALHILDPVERDLELGDVTVVEDLESGQRLPINAGKMRKDYVRAIDAHIDDLRQSCGSRRIDYSVISTDQPLDLVLFEYLNGRSRLSKARR